MIALWQGAGTKHPHEGVVQAVLDVLLRVLPQLPRDARTRWGSRFVFRSFSLAGARLVHIVQLLLLVR